MLEKIIQFLLQDEFFSIKHFVAAADIAAHFMRMMVESFNYQGLKLWCVEYFYTK
jgi:hypothetical protein